MGLRDTIENQFIIIMLDKARIVKITMRALLLLEDIYGTVTDAMESIRDLNDSTRLYHAIANFLYVMVAGLNKKEIESYLTAQNIVEAHSKILESLSCGMPIKDAASPVESHTADKYDWDYLYYFGRYHLLMSNEEFWNCTPRRYVKLRRLWEDAHGIESGAPKEMVLDEIPW